MICKIKLNCMELIIKKEKGQVIEICFTGFDDSKSNLMIIVMMMMIWSKWSIYDLGPDPYSFLRDFLVISVLKIVLFVIPAVFFIPVVLGHLWPQLGSTSGWLSVAGWEIGSVNHILEVDDVEINVGIKFLQCGAFDITIIPTFICVWYATGSELLPPTNPVIMLLSDVIASS